MKKLFSLLFVLFFLFLLLSPETALAASREGLLLWYRSILPALLPFMLLCTLALHLGVLEPLIQKIYLPLHYLTGCSFYGSLAIFTGFLCGFPMGAKMTHDLCQSKKINQAETDWLLGFVNNLSPGFLISYVAYDQLNLSSLHFLLPVNILGSALIYGIFTSMRHRSAFCTATSIKPFLCPDVCEVFSVIDSCIDQCILNITKLGIYIMIFSILKGMFHLLLPPGHLITLFLCSVMEVTGGIQLLCSTTLPYPVRFICVNALCCFGGFCALAQTAGITSMNLNSLSSYIKSRVTITLLSVLFSCSIFLFSLIL